MYFLFDIQSKIAEFHRTKGSKNKRIKPRKLLRNIDTASRSAARISREIRGWSRPLRSSRSTSATRALSTAKEVRGWVNLLT